MLRHVGVEVDFILGNGIFFADYFGVQHGHHF